MERRFGVLIAPGTTTAADGPPGRPSTALADGAV